MKGRKMNKKKKSVVVLVAVLVIGVVAGTIAYLTTLTDPITNTFTSGNVDITSEEPSWNPEDNPIVPGVDIPKDPTIKNVGTEDAFVAYKVTIDPALAAVINTVDYDTTNWATYDTTDANTKLWIKKAPLTSNASATLFNKVSVKSNATTETVLAANNSQLVVQGGAVQAEGFTLETVKNEFASLFGITLQ